MDDNTCLVCAKKFTRKNNLILHDSRENCFPGNYCVYCNSSFTNASRHKKLESHNLNLAIKGPINFNEDELNDFDVSGNVKLRDSEIDDKFGEIRKDIVTFIILKKFRDWGSFYVFKDKMFIKSENSWKSVNLNKTVDALIEYSTIYAEERIQEKVFRPNVLDIKELLHSKRYKNNKFVSTRKRLSNYNEFLRF